MLLAENFVLLALDEDGTIARGSSYQAAAAVGVTGALVTELLRDGHITLDDGRIHVTGTVPSDPLLAQVVENLVPFEGKRLKSKLANVKHSGWTEVVDRMIDNGMLGRDKEFLHATRHPVIDVEGHRLLLAEIRSAATGSGPMDERIAVLLALAGPCQMLEIVAPDKDDRKRAKARIAEATEQVPAASAVKYVIEAAVAAIAVGAAAAVIVST